MPSIARARPRLAEASAWDAAQFLAPEQVRQRQLQLVRRQLVYVAERSALYRRKFDAHGLDPSGPRSLPELSAWPTTAKAELRQAQAEHPPFGRQLCVPPEEISWIATTSGTTGEPLVLPRTPGDIVHWSGIAARALRRMGLLPTDVYQNIAAYHYGAAGLILHRGAEQVGAAVINAGLGNTGRHVWALANLGTTFAHATPSYWLRLGQELQASGLAERCTLRVAFGGGEPGMKSSAITERLRSYFPTVRGFRDCYGVTDIGTPLAAECEAGAGAHIEHLDVLVEVIDPASGEPCDEDEIGELVLTDLRSRTAPLVRFRTGDLARLSFAPCECGRRSARLVHGILGRADDAMTVRGTTLYPSAVEDVLRRLPSVGEWQLHHDGSAQRPILLAEWTGPDAADQRAAAVVVERLRTALQVTVEIRWLEPGEIPAPDGSKIRRFGRDDLRSSSATH